jgi:hypothetical protein
VPVVGGGSREGEVWDSNLRSSYPLALTFPLCKYSPSNDQAYSE